VKRWLVGCCSRRCYFFIAMMNAAMSWASLRLSGKFGIVACGKRKKEAIMSEVIVSLFAMDANEDTPLNFTGADPIA
jgi:hypothetical protein